MFFPQLSLRFLSVKDYFLRNFILGKLNISSSIWQEFCRSTSEAVNVHPISNFRLGTTSCYYHGSQQKLSFEVSSFSMLIHSNGSSNSQPNPILFLLAYSSSHNISHLIPVEYCDHKYQGKVSTIFITL